jgi:transcriptional regulator with XRE-family HTH domain
MQMPPVRKPKHKRTPTFIAEWRKAAGFKQIQAAKELGVEQSTISKTETGKSPYEQDFLERMAALYKSTAADLIARRPGQRGSDEDRGQANEAFAMAIVELVNPSMLPILDLQKLVAKAESRLKRSARQPRQATPQAPQSSIRQASRKEPPNKNR